MIVLQPFTDNKIEKLQLKSKINVLCILHVNAVCVWIDTFELAMWKTWKTVFIGSEN